MCVSANRTFDSSHFMLNLLQDTNTGTNWPSLLTSPLAPPSMIRFWHRSLLQPGLSRPLSLCPPVVLFSSLLPVLFIRLYGVWHWLISWGISPLAVAPPSLLLLSLHSSSVRLYLHPPLTISSAHLCPPLLASTNSIFFSQQTEISLFTKFCVFAHFNLTQHKKKMSMYSRYLHNSWTHTQFWALHNVKSMYATFEIIPSLFSSRLLRCWCGLVLNPLHFVVHLVVYAVPHMAFVEHVPVFTQDEKNQTWTWLVCVMTQINNEQQWQEQRAGNRAA